MTPGLVRRIQAELSSRRNRHCVYSASLSLVCSSFTLLFQAVYHLTLPRRSQEVRPLIFQLKEHYRDGDTLYIHPATHYTFSYYADREHLDNMKPIFGTWIGARSWASYVTDQTDKVLGRKRVWFLFSGRTDSGGLNHEDLFIAHLNRVGKKLQVFQSKGASVYLYDLRDEE